MGKLVLYRDDGTTLDIKLDRERVTIGRRADNDVCLPYPAVSGEHAAVITVLPDSFIEDLGSTNGTLVNGKPIDGRRLLRDHEEIGIGRQRLVYLFDESAKLEPSRQALGRLEQRTFGERVEPLRQRAGSAVPRADRAADARKPPAPDTATVPGPAAPSPDAIDRFVAAEIGSSPDVANSAGASLAIGHDPTPGSASPKPDPSPVPAIKVLTGPSAGRAVLLDKSETTVGRVGVQVAILRRSGEGFRLVPLEGNAPPCVNGAAIGAEGQALQIGDVLEIAGVRLELVSNAAIPTSG